MSIFNMILGDATVKKVVSSNAFGHTIVFPISEIPRQWIIVPVVTSTAQVFNFTAIYNVKTQEGSFIRGRDYSGDSISVYVETRDMISVTESIVNGSLSIGTGGYSVGNGMSYALYYI